MIIGYLFKQFINEIQDEIIKINRIFFFIFIILTILLGIFAGWGGITEQHYDWFKHGAILSDLIEYKWPVYYTNNSEHAMLTYYLGIYIIPALIGKCFGFLIAEYVLVLELIIGMMIVYLNLLLIIKPDTKIKNGMLIFGILGLNYPILLQIIYNVQKDIRVSVFGFCIIEDDKLLSGCIRSILTNFRAFPASIYVFIIVMLFYIQKDRIKDYMFIWLPVIFYSTISAIGGIWIAGIYYLYRVIKDGIKFRDIKFNIIALIAGIPIIIYLLGNILQHKPDDIGIGIQDIQLAPGSYILYLICDIIFFMVILYKSHKNEPLYYILFTGDIIFSIIRYGLYNDLLLCGTIPMTGLLIILTSETLTKTAIERNILINVLGISTATWIIFISLSMNIGNSSITEVIEKDAETNPYGYELYIINGLKTYGTMQRFIDRNNPLYANDLKYNYYTYDYEDKAFYKYISRRII